MSYNKAMKIARPQQDATDQLWRAESDAETLAEAKAIMADESRVANAQQAAVAIVQHRTENIERQQRQISELQNLAAVADGRKGRPVNVQKVRGGEDFPNEVVTPQALGRNQRRAVESVQTQPVYRY